MLVFIVVFCVVVALGFCLASAWSDWSGMTIPNTYPVGIIATFGIAAAALYFLAPEAGYLFSLKSHFISFALVFAVTFVLFSLKMIGAGDSKLAAAVALWTGVKGLFPFLFFMGITGAVLGLAALYLQKNKPVAEPKEKSWIERVQGGESTVPYGIAIAVGALIAFIQVGYFSPEKLALLVDIGTGSAAGS